VPVEHSEGRVKEVVGLSEVVGEDRSPDRAQRQPDHLGVGVEDAAVSAGAIPAPGDVAASAMTAA
jgi:hypothetical protein